MKKTLLFVSGGLEAVPGIQLAKNMGLKVVVSDLNPRAPGFAQADGKILASTYDVEQTVKAVKHYHTTVQPIDGVICLAADVPLTVAKVAAELGLPGISIEAAALSMDKLAMKRAFQREGVLVPWFSPVYSVDHLKSLVAERGYPLVLKPVDSRVARGVLRLTEKVDLEWAFHLSQGHSPSNHIMVEEFLAGPQVSTESLVMDGIAYTPGLSDRNYEYLECFAPHIIENGGELPSFLPAALQQAIREVVQQAVLSMGITDGMVKGDIVVSGGQPYVIELAARLSGGYFCTHEIPLNTGVNFVREAIRLVLGEKPHPLELQPLFQKGVAQRYLMPPPGRVIRIEGVEEVRRMEQVAMCEIRVSPGDQIRLIDSHPGRAGVIITTGESREEAVARAVEAVRLIRFEIA